MGSNSPTLGLSLTYLRAACVLTQNPARCKKPDALIPETWPPAPSELVSQKCYRAKLIFSVNFLRGKQRLRSNECQRCSKNGGRPGALCTGMVGLAPKWVRLAPNGTNPGLFQIRFQYILAQRDKRVTTYS